MTATTSFPQVTFMAWNPDDIITLSVMASAKVPNPSG